MRRNVSGQHIGAQVNLRDGSPATSSVTVNVVKDNGSQIAPGSGTATHKGSGQWDYAPTQGETDADHVAFQFVHSTGVNQVINVYPLQVELRKLGLSVGQIIEGTVTNAGFTPTTTEFEASDITEATANHFGGQPGGNGRVIIFITGALTGQAARINDYALVSGRGHFTVPAMTEAPGNGDKFIII